MSDKLKEWQNVFDHLGAPNEVGNERRKLSDKIEALEKERDALRTELDALRAWKEEAEKQEPVGWVDGGDARALSCGNAVWVHPDDQGRMLPVFARPIPAPSVPDGWQLVPIEPTQWMRVQGGEGMDDCSVVEVWRRMLAGAPKQEERK